MIAKPLNICRRPLRALALALALPLGACTAEPALMDLPGVQKLTWFSYVNADDLRQACAPGAPDRYRLIYNAHYLEQIRAYEVRADRSGGALVEARVQSGYGIAAANITLTLEDPIAAWRWQRAEHRFRPGARARFEQALEESGFFAAAPTGLRLHSNAFYWVAAGCRDGRFHFNAWTYPSPGFERLTFPGLLLRDGTQVAVNPPRKRDPGERTPRNTPPRVSRAAQTPHFVLEVGRNGLVGRRDG